MDIKSSINNSPLIKMDINHLNFLPQTNLRIISALFPWFVRSPWPYCPRHRGNSSGFIGWPVSAPSFRESLSSPSTLDAPSYKVPQFCPDCMDILRYRHRSCHPTAIWPAIPVIICLALSGRIKAVATQHSVGLIAVAPRAAILALEYNFAV